MSHETILENISTILKEQGIEKLILFGSYAWGNPDEQSDIDLLAIKDVPETKTRDFRISIKQILWKHLSHYNISFDIIVDSEKRIKKRIAMGDSFYKDILTKGKILYA